LSQNLLNKKSYSDEKRMLKGDNTKRLNIKWQI